jgi:hypothetical protein
LNGCGGPWWDVSRCALNLMEDISSTYYKYTIWATHHELNVSWHMLTWIYFLVFVCETLTQSLSATYTSYNVWSYVCLCVWAIRLSCSYAKSTVHEEVWRNRVNAQIFLSYALYIEEPG